MDWLIVSNVVKSMGRDCACANRQSNLNGTLAILGRLGKLPQLMRCQCFMFSWAHCLVGSGEGISLFREWFSTLGVPKVCIHMQKKEAFTPPKVLTHSSSLCPLPFSTLVWSYAAFNQVFGNQAWSANGSSAMCVCICQSLLVPHPSQMMATHHFAVLHFGTSLDNRSCVDLGLKHQKDVRHGVDTVAGRWLTSSPVAGRDAAADPAWQTERGSNPQGNVSGVT